jgi:hypothetical protein
MGTARTFDFTIETTSNDFTFNVVPKDDFEKLDGYLKSKKIRVTNRIGADERVAELLGDDDDDEMQSVASSDDDNEPVVRKGADVDDEDSEEGMSSDSLTSRYSLFPPFRRGFRCVV